VNIKANTEGSSRMYSKWLLLINRENIGTDARKGSK